MTADSGGIKVANNLITTEEGFALDARQGKILNEYIAQVNTDLLKMIRATGRLDGNDDWNNYLNAGVYKVQNANMTVANHAPIGVYAFGILIVLVAEMASEHRTAQIYIPDNDKANIMLALRTYNNGEWRNWRGIQGVTLAA